MKDLDAVSRFRGSLLGLAAGDALGAPVEGLKAGRIRQLYGEVNDYVDPGRAWKDKPWRWRLPGLYSDDTQQSLALADTLVKCRGFDAGEFAALLVKLAAAETGGKSGAHRGIGRNFRASVRSLLEGRDPLSAGAATAGIGAMMRAAPCGLYFRDDREGLLRSAIEQGLITHRDPRSLVMAGALAFCAARAAAGDWDRPAPERKMEELLEAASAAERLVEKDYIHLVPVSGLDRLGMAQSGLELLPRLLELPERFMAFRQIVGEANRQFPDHKITEPGDGFVMAAGLSALFIALTAADFEDGIKEAVHLGKDTDTLAAMAGAVLGARFGERGIPERWRKGLMNAEQVALRGEALLAKSVQGLQLRELVGMEAELTRQEERARAEFIKKLEAKGELKPPAPKKPKPRPEPLPQGPPLEPDQAQKLSRRGKRKKPERVKAPWKKHGSSD